MSKAAIYCRVSTEDQEKGSTSLDSQQEACLKKAKEVGFDVSQDLVLREVWSGLTLDRPQLSTLRDWVKDGDVEAVIAYTLDRLSRDPIYFIILQEELEKAGVKLILVTETVDSSDMGKLISHIRGYAAKLEVEKTKERTLRGKRELLKKGLLPQGTGKGLYGYKWDKKEKKRIPVEFEVKVVEKVFNMVASDMSYFSIARTLNGHGIPTKSGSKWHPLTIRRMLSNEAYIGLTYFGKTSGSRKSSFKVRPKEDWILLPDVTPPIIDRELFERAQKALQRSKELKLGRPSRQYLLTGHVTCGHCGSPLVGSCLNGRYRYYHCRGYYPTATRERICNARYMRADDLEKIVWGKVSHILEHPEFLSAGLEEVKPVQGGESGDVLSLDKQINKLKQRLQSYESEEQNLIKLFRHKEINEDYILNELEQLKKERRLDEEQLAQIRRAKEQLDNLVKVEEQLREYCERAGQNLKKLTFQEKRFVLDALDIKATATLEDVQIRAAIPIELTSVQSPEKFITTARTSA